MCLSLFIFLFSSICFLFVLSYFLSIILPFSFPFSLNCTPLTFSFVPILSVIAFFVFPYLLSPNYRTDIVCVFLPLGLCDSFISVFVCPCLPLSPPCSSCLLVFCRLFACVFDPVSVSRVCVCHYVYLCVCLSVCLFVCLDMCICVFCVCLFVSVLYTVGLFICASFSLPIIVIFCVSLSFLPQCCFLNAYRLINLPFFLCTSKCLSLSVCLSVCICISVCLSACLSISVSDYDSAPISLFL